MRISLTGVPIHGNSHYEKQLAGYGKVTWQLQEALIRNGVEVSINDPTTSVVIYVDNPGWLMKDIHPTPLRIGPNQHKIGLTTHESTEIVPEWKTGLETVDEIWAMSEWVADTFRKYVGDRVTLSVPVCSDSKIESQRRIFDEPFYFIHVGEPSERKMGAMVLEAFVQEFGDDENINLVFKVSDAHSLGPMNYGNVYVFGNATTEDYYQLLDRMHCLVYPTIGEGGGLIPLEALTMGMPVISTWEWADYKNFIHLKLDSTLSPVLQSIQDTTFLRGEGYSTTVESIRSNMRKVYDNYEYYSELHYAQAEEVTNEYNWDRVVKEIVIPRLEKIING